MATLETMVTINFSDLPTLKTSTVQNFFIVTGSGSLDRSTDDRAIVPATGVAEAWSECLREAIPPRGWLAVWDMNASKDYRFYGSARQIEAPVCVDVISIDFEDLEAKIEG